MSEEVRLGKYEAVAQVEVYESSTGAPKKVLITDGHHIQTLYPDEVALVLGQLFAKIVGRWFVDSEHPMDVLDVACTDLKATLLAKFHFRLDRSLEDVKQKIKSGEFK